MSEKKLLLLYEDHDGELNSNGTVIDDSDSKFSMWPLIMTPWQFSLQIGIQVYPLDNEMEPSRVFIHPFRSRARVLSNVLHIEVGVGLPARAREATNLTPKRVEALWVMAEIRAPLGECSELARNNSTNLSSDDQGTWAVAGERGQPARHFKLLRAREEVQ